MRPSPPTFRFANPPLSTFDDDIAALHAQSFGWAMACCGRNREQAAEVLQLAYFKVFSGRARFDGRSTLRTWLFGVIRLTALESRRLLSLRWFRGAPVADAGETTPAEGPTPSESVADRERAVTIEKALAELAPRQREILHLVFYESLSVREAAEIMGVSSGAASQHYERGKARLHELLTQRGLS